MPIKPIIQSLQPLESHPPYERGLFHKTISWDTYSIPRVRTIKSFSLFMAIYPNYFKVPSRGAAATSSWSCSQILMWWPEQDIVSGWGEQCREGPLNHSTNDFLSWSHWKPMPIQDHSNGQSDFLPNQWLEPHHSSPYVVFLCTSPWLLESSGWKGIWMLYPIQVYVPTSIAHKKEQMKKMLQVLKFIYKKKEKI